MDKLTVQLQTLIKSSNLPECEKERVLSLIAKLLQDYLYALKNEHSQLHPRQINCFKLSYYSALRYISECYLGYDYTRPKSENSNSSVSFSNANELPIYQIGDSVWINNDEFEQPLQFTISSEAGYFASRPLCEVFIKKSDFEKSVFTTKEKALDKKRNVPHAERE